MKLKTQKQPLLRILKRCSAVADPRSTMPILANVLLIADTELRCIATDLVLSTTGHVEAEVQEVGNVSVNAKDLLDRVLAMPEGDILLEADKYSLTLVSGKRKFKLSIVPGEEFPKIPECPVGENFDLSAESVLSLFGRTFHAVSDDTTRLHLASALFETGKGVARVVATDGHRLAKSELKEATVPKLTALVPGKGVAEIRRLCVEADPLNFSAVKGCLFVEAGDIQVSVKLTDATFPPYQQVIPETVTSTCKVDASDLATVIKAVSLSSGDNNGIRLTVREGLIIVEAESATHGDAGDEIQCSGEIAEPVTMGINAKYMVDALASIDGLVQLGFSDNMSPLLLTGDSFQAVVMPMRL